MAVALLSLMKDANDCRRANDRPHVVMKKTEKQSLTIGGLPDKTRQATHTTKGKTAWVLEDRPGGHKSLRGYRRDISFLSVGECSASSQHGGIEDS